VATQRKRVVKICWVLRTKTYARDRRAEGMSLSIWEEELITRTSSCEKALRQRANDKTAASEDRGRVTIDLKIVKRIRKNSILAGQGGRAL